MTPEEREQKIQEALKNAEAAWDAKYSQEDWAPDEPQKSTTPKARRVGKGFASKALRNL